MKKIAVACVLALMVCVLASCDFGGQSNSAQGESGAVKEATVSESASSPAAEGNAESAAEGNVESSGAEASGKTVQLPDDDLSSSSSGDSESADSGASSGQGSSSSQGSSTSDDRQDLPYIPIED